MMIMINHVKKTNDSKVDNHLKGQSRGGGARGLPPPP